MNTQFNRRVLIDLFIWNDDQNSSRHIIYVRAMLGGRGRPGPRAWLGALTAQRGDGKAVARGGRRDPACSWGPALVQVCDLGAPPPRTGS